MFIKNMFINYLLLAICLSAPKTRQGSHSTYLVHEVSMLPIE